MTPSRFTLVPLHVCLCLALIPACRDSGSADDGADDDAGSADSADGTDSGQPDTGSGGADDDSTGEPDAVTVEILRDAHGVPHIRSATDEGALYGLGYAAAEDRLFQMHLSALAAQGRLAELLGASAVQGDTKMRIMGMWRHAQRVADSLTGTEHGALLDAYAAGVNAYVADNGDAINPLFDQLGVDVEIWTPAHSVAVWYRLANFFTNDPSGKAAAYEAFLVLEAQVGTEAAVAQTLGTPHPGDPSKGVVQAADVPADVQQAIADYALSMGYGAAMAATKPTHYGHFAPKFSHAWAVSGDLTDSGQSVLVSDPQVPVTAPNLLWESAVQGATLRARGVGAPGCPGLLIGFSPHVAWGMTAAGIDQRDLFALDMVDATHHQVDGTPHEISAESEVIVVKGSADVDVTYRESAWGPVVTDMLPGGGGTEYALKGIPFAEPDRDTIVAMFEMMRAQDLGSFREAIEDWRYPSANIVVADGAGDVFYTVVGAIPLRSPDSPLGGMIAQDGASSTFDWADTIPGEFRPWVVSPAAGFVHSGNHRPVGDWYPLPLGTGQGSGGDTVRSRRIRELLVALPQPATARDVLDLVQWDCANAGRRDLVAIARQIDTVQPGTLSANAQSAIVALAAWSQSGGQMLTGSEGTFLASKISTKFRVQQTGETLNASYGGGENGLNLFAETLTGQIAADPGFVPDVDTTAYIDATLTDAWATAIAQEPNRGAWEATYAATTATLSFPLMVGPDVPALETGVVYDAPIIHCADGQTVWSQAGETYTQWVSMGAIDEATTILAPGNPEGPDADLWKSQGQLWADGALKAAPISPASIDEIAVSSKTLEIPQ